MKEVKSPKKPLIYYYCIVLLVLMVFNSFIVPLIARQQIKEVDYGTFMSMTEKGEIGKVEIESNQILFTDKDGQNVYKTGVMDDPNLTERLYASGAEFASEIVEEASPLMSFFLTWVLPIVIFVALGQLLYKKMIEKMGGGPNSMMFGLGNSNAKVYVPSTDGGIRFADVAGEDEAKDNLQEIVNYLHDPSKYKAIGASMPKGILLVGPPGTGKTMLAKAVAGEANVPFFSISGSEFVEMFVGMGASKVRNLFDQAKEKAPCIVFIDEIDAVGRHRGAGLGGGHDEREQTLNQLLVEMDGFAANEGVIVMAATNRRDILDPALLRPGRFDRQITVNYPDVDGRVEILKVHSRGKPLAADVDLENIAKRTPFATGADLENIMNEAAIRAARARKTQIDQSMLIEAVERVQMGPEKKSHKVLEEDRKLVAYHEAGHAIVGHFLPLCDEVHTVTIVPRGGAGGFTLSLPSKELDNMSRNQLLQRTSMMLGGHAAERLIFHDVYTGAQSDLQHATSTCRAMVTRFGMSDKIGTIYLDSDQEVFVGASFGHSREYSEELAAKVDAEVSELLKSCYQTAMDTLTQHQDKLNGLAELLIERETLSRGEFVAFMEGRPLPEKSKGEPAQEQTQQAETAEPAAAENTPNE